jgi:nucleoside-diphosphate-sugar epimerase
MRPSSESRRSPSVESPSPSLITGAAGFIGRRLALRLRTEGVDVRVLVRRGHDLGDLEAAGVRVVWGDASDRDTVAAAADGCRVIYHLAAARGGLKLRYRAYQRENRGISEAVGEGALAARVRRVVVASTATLVGHPGPGLQTEATPPKPNSPYRASRLVVEHVFEEFGRRGLDVVVARVPQRVMGPGARDWTRLARGVRDGRYRVLPSDGTIHSGDVDDVIDGLRLCAAHPGVGGERFLLAGPTPTRFTDVLRVMADCLDVPFQPRTVPGAPFRAYVRVGNALFRAARLSLPHHFTAEVFAARVGLDLSKARRTLGYCPRFEMPQSVDRTVTWLRGQGLV